MKPSPSGWPRMSSALYYEDAAKAIDWLCNAFGFEVRLKVQGDDGGIVHSELVFGDGVVMVASAKPGARPERAYCRSPRTLGGANTQNMMMYVDDVEAHCRRARQAGAKIVTAPMTADYGEGYWTDRNYEAEDPEGHHWWFCQRLVRDSTAK